MKPPYDYRIRAFVAGAQLATIVGSVPENMILIIHQAKYSNPGTGTQIVKLMQQSSGTITSTIDVVTLDTNTRNIVEGNAGEIIGIVDPGHELVALTEPSGSILGKVLYSYEYGRFRKP